MSNEKIIALLQAFRANDLAKALVKLQVGKWRMLFINDGESDSLGCMVELPISVNFILILDSADTTQQTISDVNQSIVECLKNIKDHFYTFAVHTESSFRSYFKDNHLSDPNTINQSLSKAESLEHCTEKFLAAYHEGQHKKKIKNLDVTSATLLSLMGSWKESSDEKPSLPPAVPPSEVPTSSFAPVPH